jgi:hypothetical protein
MGEKAFHRFGGGQACDGDELVPARFPPDDGDRCLLDSQRAAKKIDELPVGFALFRRRADFNLEDVAA